MKNRDETNPYDSVYNNLQDNVHILKPIDDGKKCGAKRFQYKMKSKNVVLRGFNTR
jgi:hypothetical protein